MALCGRTCSAASRRSGAGLVYDVLVRARELPAALEIVRSFPEMRFVVDHIAKPDIKAGEIEPWASRMQPLAACPNVWVKVSGMITEADWNAGRRTTCCPTSSDCCSGSGRIGSCSGRTGRSAPWPEATPRSWTLPGYALGDAVAGANARSVFGGNAVDAYRLEAGRPSP